MWSRRKYQELCNEEKELGDGRKSRLKVVMLHYAKAV